MPCVTSTATRHLFDDLHGFILRDGLSDDSGTSTYILRILFDVNNPAGAVIFVLIVGGIFITFVAILDSLKPPNFPPGPRWLPFGGDSSGFCEKPLTVSATAKLSARYGAVVGLRQNNSHRTSLILALNVDSANIVQAAIKDGFITETTSECLHSFAAISTPLKDELHRIIDSEEVTSILERAVLESVCDFYNNVQVTHETTNRYVSLISATVLAVTLNVMTGQRVSPASPYLIRLYEILVKLSDYRFMYDCNQRIESDELTRCASLNTQLIMVLSDFEESDMHNINRDFRPNIFSLLQNYKQINVLERYALISDLLTKANVARHGLIVENVIKNLIVLSSTRERNYYSVLKQDEVIPKDKQAWHCACRSMIDENSKTIPQLKVGQRQKVLTDFIINGFAVPKDSYVQTILSQAESHSVSEGMLCPVDYMMTNLSSQLLAQITSSPNFKFLENLSLNLQRETVKHGVIGR